MSNAGFTPGLTTISGRSTLLCFKEKFISWLVIPGLITKVSE